MVAAVEIRPLRRDDERSGFSCGQDDLDRFFHYYAAQNQFKLHLATTYVATVRGRILGFATVAASSIQRKTVPAARPRRRLPRYPLPVLRLARLGVDTRAQGRCLGRALLRHILELALEQRDRVGCIGLVTDARPDAIDFCTRHGFVPLEGVREGALHGEPIPMFLPVATLAAAIEK